MSRHLRKFHPTNIQITGLPYIINHDNKNVKTVKSCNMRKLNLANIKTYKTVFTACATTIRHIYTLGKLCIVLHPHTYDHCKLKQCTHSFEETSSYLGSLRVQSNSDDLFRYSLICLPHISNASSMRLGRVTILYVNPHSIQYV